MHEGEFPSMVDGHRFHPSTLVTHAAYAPAWSEWSAVPPMFPTSTWLFANAAEAERCFAAMHQPDAVDPETVSLAYSRINAPNVEILEKRLALLEGAQAGAVFASGMAAITTLLLAETGFDDVVLYSQPLYGGTDGFMRQHLPARGLWTGGFSTLDDLKQKLEWLTTEGKTLRLVFIETPANPTNLLHDIAAISFLVRSIPEGNKVWIVVDNTFLSPYGQQPLVFGADAVIYSLTKSIGGHGDIVGGAVLGPKELIRSVKQMRSTLGGIMSPFTAWLTMQHLATLQLRIEKMAENATLIAEYLTAHPGVSRVYFPGLPLLPSQAYIYRRQCLNGGHMIAFEVNGGKQAAFRVLDNLTVIGHAVSLGGFKSLACHPASTTHQSVAEEEKLASGVSEGLVRLSVGTEYHDDLIWDLRRALSFA